jgi:hypothetical protein
VPASSIPDEASQLEKVKAVLSVLIGEEARNISALLTLILIAQNEVSIFRLHYANYHTHCQIL